MLIGVPKENSPTERRVALVPSSIKRLAKAGHSIIVQSNAGHSAGFTDEAYISHGAEIVESRQQIFERSEIICQVRCFSANPEAGQTDLDFAREGQIIVGFCDPLGAANACAEFARTGATQFAVELVPRTTKAQSMDALSSMALIAGYRAVLLAASELPKLFPMFMTAAGTVKPARVFVIGAGVAGLQAIAISKKLGAVVKAYDVRPAVKEQVQSLGASFVELELESCDSESKAGYAKELGADFYVKQQELMASVVSESDVVITTALIPGKRAPVLVTEEMISKMRSGSVIVDLASERGGNCELSQHGRVIEAHGVKILGPDNPCADVASDASSLYSQNLANFLLYLIKDNAAQIDSEDEIIKGTLLSHGKRVVHPRVCDLLNQQ